MQPTEVAVIEQSPDHALWDLDCARVIDRAAASKVQFPIEPEHCSLHPGTY
jgi:hypothetical protein